MDNPGTVRHGNVIVTGDKMGFFVLFFSGRFCPFIQRLVFPVFQIRAFQGFQYFIGFFALLLLLLA